MGLESDIGIAARTGFSATLGTITSLTSVA